MENVNRSAAELRAQDSFDLQDFQRKWQDGTLEKNHRVSLKTRKWSEIVANKYRHPERAEDLAQSCLMALSVWNYQAQAKLDTVIVRILLHENTKQWRKSGEKNRGELPVEMQDEASQEILEGVLRRISSDKLMANLMQTRPDLQRRIALIIAQAEDRLGRKRLAQLASRQVDRKVTRYEIEVTLQQLKEALRKPGYYKAKAGVSG